MARGGTLSGGLQQLGVSYFQIIDYSSKEYTATLVGSTHNLACRRTVQLRRNQVQVWGLAMIVWDFIITLYGPYYLLG